MRALLVICAALIASQARDAGRRETGTAALVGTVTAGGSAEPVRRALVTIVFGADASRQRQLATDEQGRFAFTGLPAGNVRVTVSKPAWVTTTYGARRAGSTLGVPVALTDGQTATIAVPLIRGSVIAGTVLDESGRPMPGVSVRVQQLVVSPTGQRTFVPYANSALIPPSDDRGAYRIFGLPAGTFVVSAQPRLASSVAGEVRQPTAAELQWAERAIRDSVAGAAVAGADTPPPSGAAVTYALVFHPGVVGQDRAGAVTLAAGEERTGIDLRMQLVTTARLRGIVTGPDGRPASGVSVVVLSKGETADAERALVLFGAGLGGGTMGQSAGDGTFLLTGLEPGEYFVLARTGTAGRGVQASPDRTWAMAELSINGRDIDGITLRLAPAVSLTGRIVFDGPGQPPPSPRLTTALRAVDGRGLGVQAAGAAPGAEGAFRLDGIIPATYRFTASVPGWTMTTAMLNGRDIADSAFDIPAGQTMEGLVVSFTSAPAEVSGVLYDAAGRPTSDLSIVFAADPALWFSGSRRTRPIVRPASDGQFTFSGLVAGDYLLAALTDVSPGDLNDPEFLREVAAAAVTVTVTDSERKTQDLRIK